MPLKCCLKCSKILANWNLCSPLTKLVRFACLLILNFTVWGSTEFWRIVTKHFRISRRSNEDQVSAVGDRTCDTLLPTFKSSNSIIQRFGYSQITCSRAASKYCPRSELQMLHNCFSCWKDEKTLEPSLSRRKWSKEIKCCAYLT